MTCSSHIKYYSKYLILSREMTEQNCFLIISLWHSVRNKQLVWDLTHLRQECDTVYTVCATNFHKSWLCFSPREMKERGNIFHISEICICCTIRKCSFISCQRLWWLKVCVLLAWVWLDQMLWSVEKTQNLCRSTQPHANNISI